MGSDSAGVQDGSDSGGERLVGSGGRPGGGGRAARVGGRHQGLNSRRRPKMAKGWGGRGWMQRWWETGRQWQGSECRRQWPGQRGSEVATRTPTVGGAPRWWRVGKEGGGRDGGRRLVGGGGAARVGGGHQGTYSWRCPKMTEGWGGRGWMRWRWETGQRGSEVAAGKARFEDGLQGTYSCRHPKITEGWGGREWLRWRRETCRQRRGSEDRRCQLGQ